MLGERQRGRGTGDRQHIGVVFVVRREHERDDLRLVAPPGGKQRTNRAVDQRLVSISFSVALPSRLKKPPGMRPDA